MSRNADDGDDREGGYDLDSGPDPAVRAAASPEQSSPEGEGEDPVYAVGIGPGNLEYLIPRAERAIREADVIVGFETVVGCIADATDANLLSCGYFDEDETLERFGERVGAGERGTAVLMGDPNHSGYQFVGKVQRAVDRPVRIVPGISSLQVAASRARTPMEDSRFVTLHKSGGIADDLTALIEDVGERHLLVLPRPFDWMPEDVADHLLGSGATPSLPALVCERLTHDDEAITRTTLAELAAGAGGSSSEETSFSDLSVLVVRVE